MKKTFALILAVLMVVALFAGCGKGADTPTTPSTDTPSSSTPSTPNEGTENTDTPAEPVEEDSPYNFGKGKVAVDENGIALEKYEYTTPISTTDETLSFWTVCYTPALMPDSGDWNDLGYCQEQEKATGVHIEYVLVDSANRAENFSVLLASDDLCDLNGTGQFFYTGTVEEGIYEEEFFVNIYDYREYCPNYMYEAVSRNTTDRETYLGVFYKPDLIYAFHCLTDRVQITMSGFIRADWLDDMGKKPEDVVTWDDLEEVFEFMLNNYETCDGPMAMYQFIEMAGCWTMNAFDTLPYCTAEAAPSVFQVDGKVTFANSTQNDLDLMTMINRFWNKGLIIQNWAGCAQNTDFKGIRDGRIGYYVNSATGPYEVTDNTGDPDCYWLPIQKTLRYEGQVIHLGESHSRLTGYGHTTISASCENIPLAVAWCDWRYSDSGSFFISYGVQGEIWDYNEEGEIRFTEWTVNNPEGVNYEWVLIVHTLNQLGEHGLEIASRKFAQEGGEGIAACYDVWDNFEYDAAYQWPTDLKLSEDDTAEVAKYSNDVATYCAENYLAFIDNSKPLSDWDAYVAGLKAIGLDSMAEIYQAALDEYLAAQA